MNEQLLVGAAETTINPRPGMQIDGNLGVYRPVKEIRRDLHARAIVFGQGETRFLLLSMELLAVTQESTDLVRAFAAEELGFDPDAVAVHVVQNHSSPSMGQIGLSDRFAVTREHPWIRSSDPDYAPLVMERIKPMIRAAVDNMQPAKLAFGGAYESRVAFNRRVVMRDGSAQMGLWENPDQGLYSEGPMDPEVGVALFTSAEKKSIAALLHHTCHPVHWDPQTTVHNDWPGAWATEVQDRLLSDAVPLVLNGCCGNVFHQDCFNPKREDTPDSMGKLLTETTEQALQTMREANETPRLSYRTRRFRIPYRTFPDGTFQDAHALLKEHPEPTWHDESKTRFGWDWYFAASLVDLEHEMATEEEFEYEIQALRIGELAIVVLPGEPFVEGQLAIKERSPAQRTFVAHMSNKYVGYIPTPEAIRRGGYETRPSCASKLVPEALQIIVDASVAMLEDLYATNER